MRKINFENGSFYHVYNRGVDKRDVFMDERDYLRFLRGMREMNNESSDAQREFEKRRKPGFGNPKPGFLGLPKRVSIIAYCLNPNHYHFLLEQLEDRGIEKFMHKVGLSHTKYMNNKHNRSGYLFQGSYQAVSVQSVEQLHYVSAYVNMNAEIHGLALSSDYMWSSCPDYAGLRSGTMCDKDKILGDFRDISAYMEFANWVKDNSRSIKEELRNLSLSLEGK